LPAPLPAGPAGDRADRFREALTRLHRAVNSLYNPRNHTLGGMP
jgi:hypothetical protein